MLTMREENELLRSTSALGVFWGKGSRMQQTRENARKKPRTLHVAEEGLQRSGVAPPRTSAFTRIFDVTRGLSASGRNAGKNERFW